MGITKVWIEILEAKIFGKGSFILINTVTANQLNGITKNISISYGSANATSIIRSQPNFPKWRLGISPDLAQKLGLYIGCVLNMQLDTIQSKIKLGPLLGILIHEPLKRRITPPFGTSDAFFNECHNTGHQYGTQVAIITTRRFNLKQKIVHGWIRVDENWQLCALPLPDVIYNRIVPREAEMRKYLQNLLLALKEKYDIAIFNECFLSKKNVYEALSNDEQISEILPETVVLNKQNFINIVHKYTSLYIKPNKGSLGNGIIRLINMKKYWIYQCNDHHVDVFTKKIFSFHNLWKTLQKHTFKKDYLIQQGINFAYYTKRPFDLRVLVQKDGQGQWCITSAIARIAGNQQFVANVSRGGKLEKAVTVLASLPAKKGVNHLKNLKKCSILVAKAIEQQIEGHYAELGIDLGIDKNGSWWLIEVNAKPSKGEHTLPHDSSYTLTTRPSVKNLLAYTCYLTNMKVPREKNKKWFPL